MMSCKQYSQQLDYACNVSPFKIKYSRGDFVSSK